MITYELAVFIGTIVLIVSIVFGLVFKIGAKKIILISLFIMYLTAVSIVVFFPIVIQSKVEYVGDTTWYNLIPFKNIASTLEYGLNENAVIQIGGNILLTVPFGVFVMICLKKADWWKLLVAAISLPIIIELSQMIIGISIDNMYRNVDIDDFILNTVGVYIGYGLYYVYKRIMDICRTKNQK